MASISKQSLLIYCVCFIPVLALNSLSVCADYADNATTSIGIPTGQLTKKSLATPLLNYSTVHRDSVNDSITFLKGIDLSGSLAHTSAFQKALQTDQPEVIALAFLQAHSTFFKLDNPAHELSLKQVQEDELGYRHVRLQQHYQDIPVLDAEIIVHLNALNQVYLVNGQYLPTPVNIPSSAEISIPKAIELAATAVDTVIDCSHCTAHLVILSEDRRVSRLAYQVRVAVNIATGWQVMVDALSGDILAKISTTHSRDRYPSR